MITWERVQHIYCANKASEKQWSHGANPVALSTRSNVYKIFFNTRDSENRSYIHSLDFDVARLELADEAKPVLALEPGERDSFDDSGASVGGVVRSGQQIFLYYLGWNFTQRPTFSNTIGLAVSEDGGRTFTKQKPAPILGLSEVDRWSLSYPTIMIESGVWRMWYGSHCAVEPSSGTFRHGIRYAESRDGLHWKTDPGWCLLPVEPEEVGPCRPTVLKNSDGYHMWFCTRGERRPYRLYYASSADGISWNSERREVVLLGRTEAWDSDAQCYPFVFEHRQDLYMLYCGNRYGGTGFGLARLAKSD